MPRTEPITGAEWLARSRVINGTTHVFFVDAVLRRTLIELGTLGLPGSRLIPKKPRCTWLTAILALPA